MNAISEECSNTKRGFALVLFYTLHFQLKSYIEHWPFPFQRRKTYYTIRSNQRCTVKSWLAWTHQRIARELYKLPQSCQSILAQNCTFFTRCPTTFRCL